MGNDLLTSTRTYEDDRSAILIGFMLIGFSGAIMGALIVALVWWLA